MKKKKNKQITINNERNEIHACMNCTQAATAHAQHAQIMKNLLYFWACVRVKLKSVNLHVNNVRLMFSTLLMFGCEQYFSAVEFFNVTALRSAVHRFHSNTKRKTILNQTRLCVINYANKFWPMLLLWWLRCIAAIVAFWRSIFSIVLSHLTWRTHRIHIEFCFTLL